jgi:REP element-mobilizing transposase RayT
VHMLIAIPPKHSVSNILGFLKGKSPIWIAQNMVLSQILVCRHIGVSYPSSVG